MRRNMHISKIGLKLIKAYEGYRPVDRHLVNGHHVVGYGHIIEGDDSLVLTRPEAEDLLRRDLEPYEDMINETVHAPITQSQYDALVSLAFNIGPRAFTESDTLRALNNGRPLDAASGFDIWRKSTVDGKTYVVDALMRRRAAEKALFLRTEGKKTLPASRADLPPVKDEMVALLATEDALPVFSNDTRNGIVARVPYEIDKAADKTDDKTDDKADDETGTYMALATPAAQLTQDDVDDQYARRREDGPSGILELSEVYEDGLPRVRAPREDDDLVDATYEVDDFNYEDVPIEDVAKPEPKSEPKLELEPDFVFESENTDDASSVLEDSSSRIADTASKLSSRLDALIDNVAADDGASEAESWPESLIQAADEAEMPETNLSDISSADTSPEAKPVDIVIDNLVEDDAFRERTDSAAKYINIDPPSEAEAIKEETGYYIPLLIGMCLTAASAGAVFGNPTVVFGRLGPAIGEWGPLLSFVGLVVGIIMTLSTLYYAVKAKTQNKR